MEHENDVKSEKSPRKEFINVRVQNPIIHNTYEDGRYTTYDVCVKTNSLSFALQESSVRRRYSDFVWLRRTLSRTAEEKPPSLPMGRIFGTFSESYLRDRQLILTEFLEKVVRETTFLSNAALHLFLQSCLPRKQMDQILKKIRRRDSIDFVNLAIKKFGPRRPSLPVNQPKSSIDITNDVIRSAQSTPSFSYENGSWSHPSNPRLTESNPSNCSNLLNEIHRDESEQDEWTIINAPSSFDDVSLDVTDSSHHSSDYVSTVGYTPVTWNEFKKTEFIHSNMIPVVHPKVSALKLEQSSCRRNHSSDSFFNKYLTDLDQSKRGLAGSYPTRLDVDFQNNLRKLSLNSGWSTSPVVTDEEDSISISPRSEKQDIFTITEFDEKEVIKIGYDISSDIVTSPSDIKDSFRNVVSEDSVNDVTEIDEDANVSSSDEGDKDVKDAESQREVLNVKTQTRDLNVTNDASSPLSAEDGPNRCLNTSDSNPKFLISGSCDSELGSHESEKFYAINGGKVTSQRETSSPEVKVAD